MLEIQLDQFIKKEIVYFSTNLFTEIVEKWVTLLVTHLSFFLLKVQSL